MASRRVLLALTLALALSAAAAAEVELGGAMGEDEDFMGEEGEAGAPDEPAVVDPEGVDGEYAAPEPRGAAFFDGFQGGLGKWTHSRVGMYSGEFVVGQGAKPAFPGDRGLIVSRKARHYAVSAPVEGLADVADGFVLQYEVKMEEGMTCGGAYVKLPTDGFPGGEAFDNNVKYSVMFGPDRCGANDKVHFIFQSRNAKTGELVEHHLKDTPRVASATDKKTHLYTLVVRANGTASVGVDGVFSHSGEIMSDDFAPPLQPPEKIDDAEDTRPETWVTDKDMADPDAVKPEDWEDRKEIPDPEKPAAPEGWLFDQAPTVADPAAEQPEEWDEEDDGEWEAPHIDNPLCEVGCGEWTQPMIPNPDYKGEWEAPRVPNPEYVGEWAPRKVDNPEYYKVDKPALLPIRAVGLEIWTMDQGVIFDNLWLGKDADAAAAFAAETFEKKRAAEDAVEKAEAEKAEAERAEEEKSAKASATSALGKLDAVLSTVEDGLAPVEAWLAKIGAERVIDAMVDAGVAKPMLVVVSVPIVVVFLMLLMLGGSGKKAAAAPAKGSVADKKKRDVSSPDDKPAPGADDDAVTAAADADPPSTRRRRATAD